MIQFGHRRIVLSQKEILLIDHLLKLNVYYIRQGRRSVPKLPSYVV